MTQPSHSFSQQFLQPDVNRISSNLVISEKAGSSSQLFKSKCLYDKLCLPPTIKNNILAFFQAAGKMADIQIERAYQKQPTIFQNKKRVLLGETGKEKLPRYYKNIGLGFKTPKEVQAPSEERRRPLCPCTCAQTELTYPHLTGCCWEL